MLDLKALTRREADCTLMASLIPCSNPHLSGSKHLRITSELEPKDATITLGKAISWWGRSDVLNNHLVALWSMRDFLCDDLYHAINTIMIIYT